MNTTYLSVVIPIRNEEDIIPQLWQRLVQVFQKSGLACEAVFVDDGSTDRSFFLLKEIYEKKVHRVKIIRFARNFGHQLAITAGLREAGGEAVVVMDGDLQDPPEVIFEFLEKWKTGHEIVYGVRRSREGETFFKKITANLFYKLIRRLTNFDIPQNAGDFYLLDKKVVSVLNTMSEHHRFLRGLVAWVGFKRVGVFYDRQARKAGKTKFGFWAMVKFSFDAVTSFSFAPLRLISAFGAFVSFVSFLFISVIFYLKLFTGVTVSGWSSLMVVVLFLGGIQLLAIGLIGEYVARIGDDVKQRPLYTVSELLS